MEMSMEDLMRSPAFQQQAAMAARGIQAVGGAMVRLKKDTEKGIIEISIASQSGELVSGTVEAFAESIKIVAQTLGMEIFEG